MPQKCIHRKKHRKKEKKKIKKICPKHQHLHIQRRKENIKKLNMHSFENVPIQKVDAIPWEIDGNSIYQLKCNEDEFIDKHSNGRWWKMSESGRVDLNG